MDDTKFNILYEAITKLSSTMHNDYIRLEDKIEKLDKKIDNVKAELNDKIDNVKTELNDKIDNVKAELNDKIDNVKAELNDKIDSVKAELEAKIEKLDKKSDDIIAFVKDTAEGTYGILKQKIDSNTERIVKIEKVVFSKKLGV